MIDAHELRDVLRDLADEGTPRGADGVLAAARTGSAGSARPRRPAFSVWPPPSCWCRPWSSHGLCGRHTSGQRITTVPSTTTIAPVVHLPSSINVSHGLVRGVAVAGGRLWSVQVDALTPVSRSTARRVLDHRRALAVDDSDRVRRPRDAATDHQLWLRTSGEGAKPPAPSVLSVVDTSTRSLDVVTSVDPFGDVTAGGDLVAASGPNGVVTAREDGRTRRLGRDRPRARPRRRRAGRSARARARQADSGTSIGPLSVIPREGGEPRTFQLDQYGATVYAPRTDPHRGGFWSRPSPSNSRRGAGPVAAEARDDTAPPWFRGLDGSRGHRRTPCPADGDGAHPVENRSSPDRARDARCRHGRT